MLPKLKFQPSYEATSKLTLLRCSALTSFYNFVNSLRVGAHPCRHSPCSGLCRQYAVQCCRTSCRYSALHADCRGHQSHRIIWYVILKVFSFIAASDRTARQLRCFLSLLFVFIFVIPCTHVVDRERRTVALNVNVGGREFVELWVKGWRCGTLELLTVGS